MIYTRDYVPDGRISTFAQTKINRHEQIHV